MPVSIEPDEVSASIALDKLKSIGYPESDLLSLAIYEDWFSKVKILKRLIDSGLSLHKIDDLLSYKWFRNYRVHSKFTNSGLSNDEAKELLATEWQHIPSPIKSIIQTNLTDTEISILKNLLDDKLRMQGLAALIIKRSRPENSGGNVSSSPISDSRVKRNFETIPNALNALSSLRGVTFDWRCEEFKNYNFDKNRHIGLIAQDVEQVMPEAVITNKDGYKCIDYTGLVGLLVEAIKEQQELINILDKKISKDLANS